MVAAVRFWKIGVLIFVLLMAACARAPLVPSVKPVEEATETAKPSASYGRNTDSAGFTDTRDYPDEGAQSGAEIPAAPLVKMGTGTFVTPPEHQAGKDQQAGTIILKFEATDLREVIKVIFEDILNQSYLIDPAVQGVVTIHTTQPVSQDALLPILESILELNGAALIYNQGIYNVLSKANAKTAAVSPVIGSAPIPEQAGYRTQVVPLRYVSAKEMKKLLDPYASDTTTIRIDEARNLLILSGHSSRIGHLLETIETFDVDWLKGMSFGLFPLEYADARTLVDELMKVIGKGGGGPLADIFRLIPVERLNSVLVITHQPQYMDDARRLIEQFDLGTETAPGRRLYVYHLKYSKAETVAGLLQEILGQGPLSETPTEIPVNAPPDQRANVRSAADFKAPPPVTARGGTKAGVYNVPVADENGSPRDAGRSGVSSEYSDQVGIIANQDNNAIMVLASPLHYRAIEATIRKLDVPQRQVLIEATIAEVDLTNNLSHGVRWFLEGQVSGTPFALGLNAAAAAAGISARGLSLGIFNSAKELRFVFDLLNTESHVKFLASPHILVVDNNTARFRVGDQIPITTRSSQSVTNPDAPLVSEVQYRDTGILLSVTPRINTGGRVTLEISQEISRPAAAVEGGGNVPITQRTIDSTVVVQSGQTVVLGGLIQENLTSTQEGIPGLMDIPWLGNLFSSNTSDVARTELLITITPKVIENPIQALEVTEELRRRVQNVTDLVESVLGDEQQQNELNKSVLERMR